MEAIGNHPSYDRERIQVMVTSKEYAELLSAAEQVGPEAVVRMAKMVAQNESADKIRRAFLDMVAPVGGKAGSGPYKTLSQVPDDVFIRTLTEPKDQL
jgi:hypothetical protein